MIVDESTNESSSDGASSEIFEVSDGEVWEISVSGKEKLLNPNEKNGEVVDTPVGRIKTFFATRKLAKRFVSEICMKGSGGKFAYRQGGSGGRWVDFICRSADCQKYIKWEHDRKKESEWPNVEIESQFLSQCADSEFVSGYRERKRRGCGV